jgi:hypothetical protein
MRNLFSFLTRSRNERGGTSIGYDGDEAGKFLAATTCEHFMAIGDDEALRILAFLAAHDEALRPARGRGHAGRV